MINVSQRLRDCQKATCVLICLLLWEDLKPVSTTVLPTSFLCPKTVFQDNCSWFVFHNRCTTVKRLLVNLYACCCERNWNLFIRSALVKLQKPRKPTNRKLKEKTTSLLIRVLFGPLHWYFYFDFEFLPGWKGHQTKTENLRTLIIRRISACVPDPFTNLGKTSPGFMM